MRRTSTFQQDPETPPELSGPTVGAKMRLSPPSRRRLLTTPVPQPDLQSLFQFFRSKSSDHVDDVAFPYGAAVLQLELGSRRRVDLSKIVVEAKYSDHSATRFTTLAHPLDECAKKHWLTIRIEVLKSICDATVPVRDWPSQTTFGLRLQCCLDNDSMTCHGSLGRLSSAINGQRSFETNIASMPSIDTTCIWASRDCRSCSDHSDGLLMECAASRLVLDRPASRPRNGTGNGKAFAERHPPAP